MSIKSPIFRCLIAVSIICSAASAGQDQGLIAEDTRWQTPYYIVTSDKSGPTVLITGGVHGNEPAGAYAAEQVRHWPINKGRLIVIPRCNVPGLAANKRGMPGWRRI